MDFTREQVLDKIYEALIKIDTYLIDLDKSATITLKGLYGFVFESSFVGKKVVLNVKSGGTPKLTIDYANSGFNNSAEKSRFRKTVMLHLNNAVYEVFNNISTSLEVTTLLHFNNINHAVPIIRTNNPSRIEILPLYVLKDNDNTRDVISRLSDYENKMNDFELMALLFSLDGLNNFTNVKLNDANVLYDPDLDILLKDKREVTPSKGLQLAGVVRTVLSGQFATRLKTDYFYPYVSVVLPKCFNESTHNVSLEAALSNDIIETFYGAPVGCRIGDNPLKYRVVTSRSFLKLHRTTSQQSGIDILVLKHLDGFLLANDFRHSDAQVIEREPGVFMYKKELNGLLYKYFKRDLKGTGLLLPLDDVDNITKNLLNTNATHPQHYLTAINSFNYAPQSFNFLKGDKDDSNLYMGLEIELADGGRDKDNAAAFATLLTKGTPYAYIMSDGSLTQGFETATMPATLKGHRKHYDYKRAFEFAKDLGYTNDNCGLHVHVNKNFFTDTVAAFALLSDILEGLWDKGVTTVARRGSTHYSERPAEKSAFRQYYGKETTLSEFLSYADSFYASGEQKYFAIRTTKNTFEFRIAKGTLYEEEVYTMLEFVNNICHYVNKIIKDIEGKSTLLINVSMLDIVDFMPTVELKKLFKGGL